MRAFHLKMADGSYVSTFLLEHISCLLSVASRLLRLPVISSHTPSQGGDMLYICILRLSGISVLAQNISFHGLRSDNIFLRYQSQFGVNKNLEDNNKLRLRSDNYSSRCSEQ